MSDEETDILLATLISVLEPPIPPHAELLNALADSSGDVQLAARRLASEAGKRRVSKRKQLMSDLDSWVLPPKKALKKRIQAGDASASRRDEPNSSKSSDQKKLTSQVAQPSPAPVTSKPTSASNTALPSKVVNLMSLLRPPPVNQHNNISRLAPLTLSNPSMVAQYTPCTLHYSSLPPELACELFYTMLDAAQGWSRNKWWLFDRLVESPHRTSFFARVDGYKDNSSREDWKEAAQFWYNGRKTDPPPPFPEEMETACSYIEKIVNEEIGKRNRFPLEWAGATGQDGGTWRANVAASNCYEGTKESVGFHSDQLTYLGPYPTIASLSLGTTRTFRLREVIPGSENSERQARTYNIPLPHNSLIIMHASTQERFKHCVPPQPTIDVFRPPFPRLRVPGSSTIGSPQQDAAAERDSTSSNCRINITFRFYRPDFRAEKTPRCKCGVPCVLRPDMKGRVDWKLNSRDAKGRGERDGNRVDTESEDYNIKYWWTCYSGAQTEGKGCGMWRVMDMEAEGRGPFVGDIKK